MSVRLTVELEANELPHGDTVLPDLRLFER